MNTICYHLTIKKNYEKIKCNLENIIDSYKEINYISSSSNNNSSLDFNVNDHLTNYKKKLENIQIMIKHTGVIMRTQVQLGLACARGSHMWQ